jgi:7-carboxy-7-deazaguanine synthase
VRLGGCDVGCVWCDVKDSWDASKHPQVSIPDIIKPIKDAKAKLVVITGGEPLMHDLTELVTPLMETLEVAHELKVVVYNKTDFAWAEEHARKVGRNCKLYLQPEWGRSSQVLPLIIEYVKHNPKWRISLQIHKYMNIP